MSSGENSFVQGGTIVGFRGFQRTERALVATRPRRTQQLECGAPARESISLTRSSPGRVVVRSTRRPPFLPTGRRGVSAVTRAAPGESRVIAQTLPNRRFVTALPGLLAFVHLLALTAWTGFASNRVTSGRHYRGATILQHSRPMPRNANP